LEKQTADQLCWVRDEFHSIRQPTFPELIIIGHTSPLLPGVSPGKLARTGWPTASTLRLSPKVAG